MVWRILAFGIAATGIASFCDPAWPADLSPGTGRPDRGLTSLGSLQAWADERISGPYRIQRNVSIGHYRLVDDSDTRLAWGSYESCEAALDEISSRESRPRSSQRVVLVLHGLGPGRRSMDTLADHLRRHGPDDVIQVGYASTREDIGAHARSFDRVVSQLHGVEEMDVVAYSLGGVVVRYWLGELAASASAAHRTADAARPRMRRCVMLGPPNHGAKRAQLWTESPVGRELFDLVLGDSGWQLGPRFHEIEDRLATPVCEFGIIAGGQGTREGWHVGIPGDDDGTVGVEETMLAGAADFTVIPVRHIALMTDDRALRMTTSFLRHGYFASAATRTPIPRRRVAGHGQAPMPPSGSGFSGSPLRAPCPESQAVRR